MYRGSAPRAQFMLLIVLAFCAMLATACGDDDDPQPARDAGADVARDAPDGDATGEDAPNAILDASLPQSDVVTLIPDASSSDADAYTLPPNSITTCNGFFECVQTCPPQVDSCVGACHDAMNEEAEFHVDRFISCVNSYGCREPDCVLRNCGMEAEACFKDD